MLIRRTKGWEIPESQAIEERKYLDRRRFLGVAGAGIPEILFIDGASILEFTAAGERVALRLR